MKKQKKLWQQGNLDPGYISIMAEVDRVAKELHDSPRDHSNLIRMYQDLRDTFINRLKAFHEE
jgi:hypothetical protein